MIYKHHVPSSTDLSDDEDDNALNNGLDDVVLVLSPAQWSRRATNNLPRRAAPRSSISRLPPEVLIHALKHLHAPKDLLSCLRVSRTWCECSVELLWHKPVFPKFATVEKMARLIATPDQTFTYASFIRRLNFLSLGHDLKDDIFSVLARCDKLERLTLVNCDHLSSPALNHVLPSYPNLVAVDLTGVSNTLDDAIVGLAHASKRLQGINLAGCKHVSDTGVLALANNCPLLRRVKLSGLELLTDAPVSALALNCPLLLEIDLNHCKLITDLSIRNIWTHCTNMREMRLSHCVQLTDAAFPAPPKPDTSADANISVNVNPFPNSSSPSSHEDLPPLMIPRPFEHLRMLDLTACSLITDDTVEGIIAQAPKIRNLVLSKCGLLTDKSVDNICALGRHLHYLHLGHAAKITDRSVRTLARSCTRLRYIDFANCVLLTDMSVFELSQLPKLRRIGLVRVNNLTDEAIYALGERHATLERIHLSYCDQISVMAVHFLLLKLHKLTHLSLTGVPAFRQPELQQFCRPPPNEFSSTQQLAFCVYSGKGVAQLRAFLTELFDHITEMDGTDDTEEEDDEIDATAYQEDDTPEPEPQEDGHGSSPDVPADGDEDADEDDTADASRRMYLNLRQLALSSSSSRAGTSSRAPPPQPVAAVPQGHEFVFHRERVITTHRVATIPPTDRAEVTTTSANLQGATMSLNAQILAASTSSTGGSASTSATARTRGGSKTVADVLPIDETDANSNYAYNNEAYDANGQGAAFFRTYQPQNRSEYPERGNGGALTPDLNFAEIGHGRGVHQHVQQFAAPGGGSSSSRAAAGVDLRDVNVNFLRRGHGHAPRPRPPFIEVDHTGAGPPTTNSTQQHRHSGRAPSRSPDPRVLSTATTTATTANIDSAGAISSRTVPTSSDSGIGSSASALWPYREPASPPPASLPSEAAGDAGRGRSVKRSLRNTLNVAEQYASSLLFGRSGAGHEEAGGSGGGSGGH